MLDNGYLKDLKFEVKNAVFKIMILFWQKTLINNFKINSKAFKYLAIYGAVFYAENATQFL